MTNPSKSDFIVEVPQVADPLYPGRAVDSRLRIGHPIETTEGRATLADVAFARSILDQIPADRQPPGGADAFSSPALTEDNLDVKRNLAFRPGTGVAALTGGSSLTFAHHNAETRVVDGAVVIAAVDQSFSPDAANPEQTAPGLSYLRLGKPEPKLTDAEGKPLERRFDRLMDQKYNSGIGLFSDGPLFAWTQKPLNFRSNEAFFITAPAYSLSQYGESRIISYELSNKDDIARVNAGDLADVDVGRKVMNVNWLRPTELGWYRQIFDRARALSYTTANKGDVGTGAFYSLGVGAKFEHAASVGLGTSYAGKVDVNKGFSIDIGATSATFKHPFGAWTQDFSAELSGMTSVKIGVAGVDSIAIDGFIKGYSVALHLAVAAQTAAFAAYNGVLAARADQTLTGADALNKGDDTHGLLTALEAGVKVYEAAISLSAITCAAGITLAAVQAGWSAARIKKVVAATPAIEMDHTGIVLKHGASLIRISPAGIIIQAAGGSVITSGAQIINMAPSINNFPQALPPLPV